MCHKHFDHLGLVLEHFDPVGRLRTQDLAGRPIDNEVSTDSGETINSTSSMVNFILANRRDDFIETFSRKFLGYALGRSVILSDEPLLDEMKLKLSENDFRFSVLFETVIQSPQFLKQRGKDFVATK